MTITADLLHGLAACMSVTYCNDILVHHVGASASHQQQAVTVTEHAQDMLQQVRACPISRVRSAAACATVDFLASKPYASCCISSSSFFSCEIKLLWFKMSSDLDLTNSCVSELQHHRPARDSSTTVCILGTDVCRAGVT